MSNKAFINTDVWKDDEFIDLSIDAKAAYMILLMGPDRKYIDVFKLHKKVISVILGYTERQLEVAFKALSDKGFIEIYDGYVGITKSYAVELNGAYNKINSEREYDKLPENVRLHFYPNGRTVDTTVKPKKVKPGPAPETIKDIISSQPEALREPLSELVADRIERKKAPTTRAVKGWIKKLERMYPNQINKRVESIDQTIEKGWMGLFEVKSNDRTSESREFM